MLINPLILTRLMGRLLKVLAICLIVLLHFSCSRKTVPTASKAVSEEVNKAVSDSVCADQAFVEEGAGPDTISDAFTMMDSAAVDSVIAPEEVDSIPEYPELDILDLNSDPVILPKEDTICIIGTGDIMPGTNYPDSRYLPAGGCASLFDPVRDILSSGDLTFGNLEGVFSSFGGTAKKCNNPKTCYVFRMPDEYLSCILNAGYDVLSLANNHVNDFGLDGRINTYNLLEEAGVPFAGFQSKPSCIFEKNGIIYGFAAFAPHIGTANLKDYARAAGIVAELEDSCDIVIVSFHGGAEGKDHQHIPCTDEVYLGYNRGNVCKFAHAVIDAGADIVFGHGPHVTRAMELYKERLICYSLGNFCTYARFNLAGPNGIAPIVKVQVSRQGEFLGGEIIPVYQPGQGGPRLDTQGRVITKIQELIDADFPGGALEVNNQGLIKIK